MTQVPRYLVLGPLSPGGEHRAALGLAFDGGGSPRPVVYVWVPDIVAEDPERYADLVHETERAARLFHPNILQVFGLETVENKLARVVAFADGEPLRKVLDAGGRLPAALAARVIADACTGVQFAHGKGGLELPLVHGNLSPEALLVSHDGTAQVSGYGTANAFAGLPGRSWQVLLSPEQLEHGERAARRETDIYLLGQILYECLAGEGPFANTPDPAKAVLTTVPPSLEPLGVPPALAAVVTKAMARKPEDRFPTAEAMGQALQTAAGSPVAVSALAAYMDALFPADAGARGERRSRLEKAIQAGAQRSVKRSTSTEVADDLIVGEATPAGIPVPSATPRLSAAARPVATTPSAALAKAAAPVAAAPRAATPQPLPAQSVTPPGAAAPAPARTQQGPRPAAEVIDLITTAEIVVSSASPEPPPDLITTADIVRPVAHVVRKSDPVTRAESVLTSTHSDGPGKGNKTEPFFPKFATPSGPHGPGQVEPAPAGPAPRRLSPMILPVGGLVIAAVGFLSGYGLSFIGGEPGASASPTVIAEQRPPPVPEVKPPPPPPQPVQAVPPPPPPQPVAVAPPPPPPPPHPVKSRPVQVAAKQPTAQPVKVKPPPPVKVAKPAPVVGGVGVVEVRAPDGAKVFLDGKLIGKGNVVRPKVPEGPHRVTVTLGESQAEEEFKLEAGGNYLYEVTPRAE
jgi:serine/threonine-protein kinase